ncbi:hypothetical protein GYMLUDRAFT_562091 [Collybiopsis luxurians FD-317 M1]|uniref:Uncharacterized protein n=1 Tax=Collybiopsis luxurians FD-317 M1 TaxID=944289 RepID=A0A0D0C1T1_9AGAR|nr:hypothetical protein GYMLUDRAFT_562091 [Collybiopsis luxurians FD-317 M1]
MCEGKIGFNEVQKNLYLKISAFFLGNSRVYPGKWDNRDLWYGEGKYRNLRLFDQSGNFTIDPESLRLLGLLYEDFEEFKEQGDLNFYQDAEQYYTKWTRDNTSRCTSHVR